MKDPLVKGHPLHAIATDLPIGGITIGLLCDSASLLLSASLWREMADLALAFALVGGLVAAGLGYWDYRAVPREHPARRTGAWHGWLNAGALVLLAASVAVRSVGPRPLAIGLAALAFTVMAAAAWLGGQLVYRLGWRVVPAEHAEQLENDLRGTGEAARIERAHRAVEEYEQTHALLP